jgi:predicted dehydrogenase
MLNQSPHAFDSFIWLGGMPSRVVGRALTRAHDIEVEDCAMALLEYPGGAVGTIYTSTYEFPEIRLQQFVGDRATLEIRGTSMRLGTSVPYADEMLRNSQEPWDIPLDVWTDVPVRDRPHGHRFITQNFVDAILDDVPLTCPGEEGIRSLELANAITVSSAKGREVRLPLNTRLFDGLLAKYMRQSKEKKPKGDSDRVVIPTR